MNKKHDCYSQILADVIVYIFAHKHNKLIEDIALCTNFIQKLKELVNVSTFYKFHLFAINNNGTSSNQNYEMAEWQKCSTYVFLKFGVLQRKFLQKYLVYQAQNYQDIWNQIVWLSKSTLLPDEDLVCAVKKSWSIPKWQLWDKGWNLNPLYILSTMIYIFHDNHYFLSNIQKLYFISFIRWK